LRTASVSTRSSGSSRIAFQTLHPRKYEEIKQMVAERRTDREEHRARGGDGAAEGARQGRHPGGDLGRAKHFYSIYDKMAKKGREFNEIYDLTAMRVIAERGGATRGRATATARSA
jgi:Guanosine polyphosphate pyrophosphohydrolases/synthetases